MSDKSFGVKPGQKWAFRKFGADGEAKVMAVVDGYAMMRYPKCMPFTAYCRHMAQGESWVLVRDVDAKKAMASEVKR